MPRTVGCVSRLDPAAEHARPLDAVSLDRGDSALAAMQRWPGCGSGHGSALGCLLTPETLVVGRWRPGGHAAPGAADGDAVAFGTEGTHRRRLREGLGQLTGVDIADYKPG